LAITAHQRAQKHSEEQRAHFSATKRQVQGLRSKEVTGEHQHRRYKQCDLNGTAQSDANRLIHLVSSSHCDSRSAFRCPAYDGEQNDSDERG
jgi:hypothetical protein